MDTKLRKVLTAIACVAPLLVTAQAPAANDSSSKSDQQANTGSQYTEVTGEIMYYDSLDSTLVLKNRNTVHMIKLAPDAVCEEDGKSVPRKALSPGEQVVAGVRFASLQPIGERIEIIGTSTQPDTLAPPPEST